MFGIAVFNWQVYGEQDMNKQIFVKEVMKANPVIVQPFATVLEAARLMKDKKVDNIIVTEQGHPLGIVTQRDIINKVICEGKNASDLSTEDIMSTPIVIIDPYCSLQEALQIMGKRNIHQLPVIENNQLIGIITHHDISLMSPAIVELDLEWSTIEEKDKENIPEQSFSGKCEDCGGLSTNLKLVEGKLLCEECNAGLKNE
jgi:CBS domain-containing protein